MGWWIDLAGYHLFQRGVDQWTQYPIYVFTSTVHSYSTAETSKTSFSSNINYKC